VSARRVVTAGQAANRDARGRNETRAGVDEGKPKPGKRGLTMPAVVLPDTYLFASPVNFSSMSALAHPGCTIVSPTPTASPGS
jgi:hypothetical protein